jgi:hypothetical protein
MSASNIVHRLRASRRAEPAPAETPERNPELEERRRGLEDELATLQWDLGGLTYEMAIRDHFRLDVLVRAAARLQEVDAELAEVERLLAAEQRSEAGSCPNCAAPHSRGAAFCWQCGTSLLSDD